MNKLNLILLLGLTTTTGLVYAADPDPYARVNLSYFWSEEENNSRDNASRIGVRGDFLITDNTSVVYQIEQGVDLAHGGDNLDTLLSTRNSFIGLKGALGTLFWGTHDTPLKLAQGRFDRFNDHQGDIKTLLAGEVRARDAYGYIAPEWRGVTARAMYVPRDNNFDASHSVSLAFGHENWSYGFAIDSDMRRNDRTASKTNVYDSLRARVSYRRAGWNLGLILQASEQQNLAGADRESGYVASLGYSRGKLTYMAQHGASDIVERGGKGTSIGLQYSVRSNFRTYLHYWHHEAKAASDNLDQVSLGLEYRL